MSEQAEKVPAGTIDLTPTWRGVVPLLIAALQEGTPEGKAAARVELIRMAGIADSAVNSAAMVRALEAISTVAGNLTDDALMTASGPNDARHRGTMVVNAREIALETLKFVEGKS